MPTEHDPAQQQHGVPHVAAAGGAADDEGAPLQLHQLEGGAGRTGREVQGGGRRPLRLLVSIIW